MSAYGKYKLSSSIDEALAAHSSLAAKKRNTPQLAIIASPGVMIIISYQNVTSCHVFIGAWKLSISLYRRKMRAHADIS